MICSHDWQSTVRMHQLAALRGPGAELQHLMQRGNATGHRFERLNMPAVSEGESSCSSAPASLPLPPLLVSLPTLVFHHPYL